MTKIKNLRKGLIKPKLIMDWRYLKIQMIKDPGAFVREVKGKRFES